MVRKQQKTKQQKTTVCSLMSMVAPVIAHLELKVCVHVCVSQENKHDE